MARSSKERIIAQAMQMFVSQGIKSVRMDDIARQLGVSKRTLYELFEDKEELLYLAMAYYSERDRQRWIELAARSGNVLDALFSVLGEVMANAEIAGCMMDNLQKFYPSVYDRLVRENMVKSRQDLSDMLAQGIAEGLFVPTINVELAISLLYYTASAPMARKELILPQGMTRQEAFLQIISNFFRGISTAKGLQMIDEHLKRYETAIIGKSSR